MNEIYEGQWIDTNAFGRVLIKKIYTHHETSELCCDCKSEAGDILHLSMAYVRRLLG